jgi:MSHA pilin protein MshD
MCITERRRAHGVTLLELIVFIVVVSVAVVGVLTALNISNKASTDPMIQKQALAIAEALLEEIQLQPFTYCDPDDSQAATALTASVGANGCSAAAGVEAMGAEATAPYGPETRTDATTPFDNVNDYNTFTMGPGITDISGNAVAGLGGYSATVAVAQQALDVIPAAASLLITVTVTMPASNVTVTLDGYRVRYAPNTLP